MKAAKKRIFPSAQDRAIHQLYLHLHSKEFREPFDELVRMFRADKWVERRTKRKEKRYHE